MSNERQIIEFIELVWNKKQTELVPDYVHPEYKIFLDNADPWEGKTLNHAEYLKRLGYSFQSFPDIHFEITSSIEDGNCVAINWILTGTNFGPMGEIPPTGKCMQTEGVTIYHFADGKIAGHTQVFNRTRVAQQLGFI